MKIYLILLCILSFIRSQLFDFCSNEEYLSSNKNDCIKIQGCCFAKISLGNISLTNCFKKLKFEGDNCENYKNITMTFGNILDECECN